MASCLPVELHGSNLGERHQYFNSMVKSAFKQKIELKSVLQIEEQSAIDRIYKIDLASKFRDVDYILQNLKDDDMLYVSRALKSRWLLEPQYRDIMNPRHLEEAVFPHMIQPAINKMRHWIQTNLKDSTRCQDFYEYYMDQHRIAIKFLRHCSLDYILTKVVNVLDKLSPQDLKIICETCPEAGKVYLEELNANEVALKRYLENETIYFKSLQCILKLNATLYLDILEKYFNISKFEPLSPAATKYIIKNHKDRFKAKPELYSSYFLHFKTLANLLSAEEAKDLVLQLAKAEYLDLRFSYQSVEPLIKRLSLEERSAFKKQVFVDKDIGKKIKDWPYPTPITFKLESNDSRNIFLDKQQNLLDFYSFDMSYMGELVQCCGEFQCNRIEIKTKLEELFDQYRFKGFESTFEELRKKLLIEGTIEGRMNILLVLVSKTGGIPENLEKLLKLLTVKHINEPCNLRAAVVRSLVKRACVWRLPADLWTMLMEFGRDLGLEGQQAELVCREGLHALVLRNLINAIPISTTVKISFLNNFSTLIEYKLNSEERIYVGQRLGKLILDIHPIFLLNILTEYKIKINEIPDAEMTLVEKARNDSDLAQSLFQSKICRRYLFKESFRFNKNNESFVNALKHDTSVLQSGKIFANLVSEKRPHHDRFLQSLVLYFNETNGLAEQHKASLVDVMKTTPRPWFARTINILSSSASLLVMLKELDNNAAKETGKTKLSATFRATAHKCRPKLNIMSVEWQWLGAKAIANRVLVCREKDRDNNIHLLLQWRRTVRIAIRLGLTNKSSSEIFITASKLRPAVALKVANKTYLKNDTIELSVWEVLRKLIEDLKTETTSKYFLKELKNNDSIPRNIETEYWEVLYKLFLKTDKNRAMSILFKLENLLYSVDDEFIRNIIDGFLNEELSYKRLIINDEYGDRDRSLIIRIIAKYLLICTSEVEQKEKLNNICNVFFDKIETLKGTLKEKKHFQKLYNFLLEFIRALKYNKVFLGEYTSSMPVFELVLQRMKMLLPMIQNLALYLEMHLIILYYDTVKQSLKQKPNVFENLDQNLDEAIETFGLNFGQNIGQQIKELTIEYYFSVIDIYKDILVEFLDTLSSYRADNAILVPVLKGLLIFGEPESLLLALFVLKKRGSCVPDSSTKLLNEDLKAFNNDVVNVFFYSSNLI